MLAMQKISIAALLVMCGLTYAAEQSLWNRFTSAPVVKYAPSVVTAGIGLYNLNNLLTRGISRDSIYSLGLAASPLLAQYALYRDAQPQGDPNSLERPTFANKWRFALPTFGLMSLLALHSGYRNFWSTAPYQAAGTTVGLILPGAVGAWLMAKAEKESDAQKYALWQNNVQEEKRAKELSAQDLLVDTKQFGDACVNGIPSAIETLWQADQSRKNLFVDQISAVQVNNIMQVSENSRLDSLYEGMFLGLLHEVSAEAFKSIERMKKSLAEGILSEINDNPVPMQEISFRLVLSYLSTLSDERLPETVQELKVKYPSAMKHFAQVLDKRIKLQKSKELILLPALFYGFQDDGNKVADILKKAEVDQ